MLLDLLEGLGPKLPGEPTPHRVDHLAAADVLVAGRGEFLAVKHSDGYVAGVRKALARGDLVDALA